MRTARPSQFDSPDELSTKARALLGENYRQYSTADKLIIIGLFGSPLEEKHTLESEKGRLGEITKRYTEIEGGGDALRKQASAMVKASLPSYVSSNLSSVEHASFESQLPGVLEKPKRQQYNSQNSPWE